MDNGSMPNQEKELARLREELAAAKREKAEWQNTAEHIRLSLESERDNLNAMACDEHLEAEWFRGVPCPKCLARDLAHAKTTWNGANILRLESERDAARAEVEKAKCCACGKLAVHGNCGECVNAEVNRLHSRAERAEAELADYKAGMKREGCFKCRTVLGLYEKDLRAIEAENKMLKNKYENAFTRDHFAQERIAALSASEDSAGEAKPNLLERCAVLVRQISDDWRWFKTMNGDRLWDKCGPKADALRTEMDALPSRPSSEAAKEPGSVEEAQIMSQDRKLDSWGRDMAKDEPKCDPACTHRTSMEKPGSYICKKHRAEKPQGSAD